MTRRPSTIAEQEVRAVVEYLVYDGRSIVSRRLVDDTINDHPWSFPHMATLPERDRLETITYYLSRWYPLTNQTGRRPKNKSWLLCNERGSPCLA
jgi:hypothetical protein